MMIWIHIEEIQKTSNTLFKMKDSEKDLDEKESAS